MAHANARSRGSVEDAGAVAMQGQAVGDADGGDLNIRSDSREFLTVSFELDLTFFKRNSMLLLHFVCKV